MKRITNLFALLLTVTVATFATTNAIAGPSAGNYSNQVLTTANLDSHVAIAPNNLGQATTAIQPVANVTSLSAVFRTTTPPAGNEYSRISNNSQGYYNNGTAALSVSTAPAANGQVAITSSTGVTYAVVDLTSNIAGNLNQFNSGATLSGYLNQIIYNRSSIGSTNMSPPALPLEKTLAQSKHRSVTFTASNAGIPSAVGHAFISAATKSL